MHTTDGKKMSNRARNQKNAERDRIEAKRKTPCKLHERHDPSCPLCPK